MRRSLSIAILIAPLLLQAQVPKDFVDITQINANIQVELRYYSVHNFIGDTIDGYEAPVLYLTRPAATALDRVQQALEKRGLGLKVFDAYRPQQAVDHFVRWAQHTEDTLMKASYYPHVDKSDLFDKGYIAARSGHSRGSTVDLTIIHLDTKEEVDMGSPFDRFDPISHHDTDRITQQKATNRRLLKEVMGSHGFKPYQEEWWHYTLTDEPFPDTYFDFIIK